MMKKTKLMCAIFALVLAVQAPVSADSYYYVTPYGKCYHKANCRYVRGKKNAKKLPASVAKKKYRACKVCIK